MRLSALLAAAVVLLALPGISFAQVAGTGEDTVLATVNGAEIRRSDIDAMHARLPPNLRSAPPQQIFPAILDQLIRNKLVAAAGRSQNLQDSDEVRRRLAEIEDDIIGQVYISNLIENAVTDEVMRARYETEFGGTGEAEIRASHILLDNEDDARAVLEEIAAGADFATLARERSVGPSAGRGGDLGYFRQADMVAEFAEAAFAMAPGETTVEPVQTQFGWHVILVVDKRVSEPTAFETVRQQLQDQVAREVIDSHMAELRDGASIQRFNFDGTPITDQ